MFGHRSNRGLVIINNFTDTGQDEESAPYSIIYFIQEETQMDWQTVLLSVLSIVLTALVTWASERLISYLNTKITNTKYAKYLTDAVDIVTGAVKSTYQTYVEALKDKNMFTEEAQKEALTRATNMALSQLSQELQTFITTNFGDLEGWIQNAIESSLYDLKNKPTSDKAN